MSMFIMIIITIMPIAYVVSISSESKLRCLSTELTGLIKTIGRHCVNRRVGWLKRSGV